MLFFRQAWTLTAKNILIVLFRHAWSTPARCFLLPVIFTWFLAYARSLFVPPSHYGIADATPVRSLANALSAAGGGRHVVALVHNGFTGGHIEQVIQQVAETVRASGKTVNIVSNEDELLTKCRSSLRGTTPCFGAAVFYSSPTEGPGGMWNYSLRADGGLGTKIDISQDNNDAEIYPMPLQHAIDFTIASLNTTIDQNALPKQVYQYPFTSQTQQQRNDDIRVRYMGGIIDILGVAFFIGVVGVTYQLVGLMASERERGMTQLIDGMMPNLRRWQPQAARLLSTHLAFDIMFLPGWIGMALILSYGVFAKTSVALIVFFNILAGLSLTSFSIFGGCFFKKAQLSGIFTTIVCLLLAVLAQIIHASSTGAVAVLSLLFPPMNYVFFIINMARWERQNAGTSLSKVAPENTWQLPGIVLWIFLIIHIFAFPILGALVERALYGTNSKGRKVFVDRDGSSPAVELKGFTKQYTPSWFSRTVGSRFTKPKDTVVAVNCLDLSIPAGQIMVLLGANGSGKSTTLDAIAGLNTISSGTIDVDSFGGIGYCPQKNVLWDEVTSMEHVRIFNRLKSTTKAEGVPELENLLKACDLDRKLEAKAKTLSGGQKRKLQLAMMFTGGSRVCCVDECSSGVDALARSKLWEILLAERGRRTIIFTTHFLDEADLLSDQIAILSKGVLKAEGSAVALKASLGGGYRIHIYHPVAAAPSLNIEGVPKTVLYDQTIFTAKDSAQAASLITTLEEEGIKDYEISGPTIEDSFFKVAEETETEEVLPQITKEEETLPTKTFDKRTVVLEQRISQDVQHEKSPKLRSGKQIGFARQAFVLFRKRWTILRRNPLPYLAAFLIPVVAAGLVTLFLNGFHPVGCSPAEQYSAGAVSSLLSQVRYDLVVGPSYKLSTDALGRIGSTLPGAASGSGQALLNLSRSIHMVDTLTEFNDYIHQNYANVTPGGFFLGDHNSPPTFAFKGNGDISLATITQNAMDILLTNVSISTQYQRFGIPWAPDTGKSLQLIVYFGLAMAAAPAFFSLYPTAERLRNVRALHYSNGVRSLPLWLAYMSFDFLIILAASILAIIIFIGVSNAWYYPGYLFVVFSCYGLASVLLSYVVSLFARSQLAAFAFAAAYQAVMFLLYFIAYLSVLTYSPTNKLDSYENVVHFTIGLITPTGNLIRAMFVSLNIFSILCQDTNSIASYPGQITLYGGPILYTILQSFALFGVLLWWDSGLLIWTLLRRKTYREEDSEDTETREDEVNAEVVRVNKSADGLRVMHLQKAYGGNVAVQDITFGVAHDECFALLGPNGAGKSTTISLIRGDIKGSNNGGEIYIEDIPISKRRAAARQSLGVCPQHDAMDQMTVIEHLEFYARIRGVDDVNHNVREVIRGVGLEAFSNRMAATLSGGNKRKLSLAIALTGGPTVLLLDEPSSGMDVISKRVMWRTLASINPGRSLVLTTHSMEEADALANRAGIMAKKMLALGTSDYLRRKHGDRYHVHLITRTAPHTTSEEMDRIKMWVIEHFDGAQVEQKTYHGQLRFSIPARTKRDKASNGEASFRSNMADTAKKDTATNGIGSLFTLLESQKEELGFEYYSVSQTTLDQVFLSIVGKHKVEEENYHEGVGKRGIWKRIMKRR